MAAVNRLEGSSVPAATVPVTVPTVSAAVLVNVSHLPVVVSEPASVPTLLPLASSVAQPALSVTLRLPAAIGEVLDCVMLPVAVNRTVAVPALTGPVLPVAPIASVPALRTLTSALLAVIPVSTRNEPDAATVPIVKVVVLSFNVIGPPDAPSLAANVPETAFVPSRMMPFEVPLIALRLVVVIVLDSLMPVAATSRAFPAVSLSGNDRASEPLVLRLMSPPVADTVPELLKLMVGDVAVAPVPTFRLPAEVETVPLNATVPTLALTPVQMLAEPKV